jgi:hypothetical protein
MEAQMSCDEQLCRYTGRTWDEWCAIIDAWQGEKTSFVAIATYLVECYGLRRLCAQAIAVNYRWSQINPDRTAFGIPRRSSNSGSVWVDEGSEPCMERIDRDSYALERQLAQLKIDMGTVRQQFIQATAVQLKQWFIEKTKEQIRRDMHQVLAYGEDWLNALKADLEQLRANSEVLANRFLSNAGLWWDLTPSEDIYRSLTSSLSGRWEPLGLDRAIRLALGQLGTGVTRSRLVSEGYGNRRGGEGCVGGLARQRSFSLRGLPVLSTRARVVARPTFVNGTVPSADGRSVSTDYSSQSVAQTTA